jgi:uncharacterized C2H2 Zn-finger protein
MSEQGMGGYRCQACGMIFNSLEELDTHTRKEHKTTVWLQVRLHCLFKNLTQSSILFLPKPQTEPL